MPNFQHAFHKVLSLTPTVSTGAYADGDNIGGKLSFEGAVRAADPVDIGGVIRSVIITDLAAQVTDIEVVFFDADPSATTFTDNAALDVADADLVKLIGAVVVSTWQPFADNSMGYATGLYIPYTLGTGTTLYGAMIATGATDLVSTSDITIQIGLELD